MYANKVDPVPLPTEGSLHILKNGYVYWENDAKWNKDRKQMVDSRVAIGKLVKDDDTHMYPNQRYFELFDPDHVELPSPGDFGRTLNYGVYQALYSTAEKIGCLEVLQKAFPDIWREVLALCVYAADDQKLVAQGFSDWSFHNYCGLEAPLSTTAITRLYEDIASSPEAQKLFLSEFHTIYHERFPETKKNCLAFDSTDQDTESKQVTHAERRKHTKSGKRHPIVNTAMFADEETGIPLFYEHYYGSLQDKTETPFTIEKAKEFGFDDLFVMMDRGYWGPDTAMSLADMRFGLAVPESTDLVEALIKEHGKTIFYREEYYFEESNAYGLRLPDTEVWNRKYNGYLFFDPERAEEERNQLHSKIKVMLKEAQNRKRFTETFRHKYDPWLIVSPLEQAVNGRRFTVERNMETIDEALAAAGMFAVISNTDLDASAMLRYYRLREQGEKVFKRLKDHFDLGTTYVHGQSTFDGKMFVAFVALIIVQAYQWFVRSVERKVASDTVATTLGTLRKYQITIRGKDSWFPVYAATKRQKDLLACFDLTESSVQQNIRTILLQV